MSKVKSYEGKPSEFQIFDTELSVDSPGRINLIGEHTDYNNGFVMPTAIDKKIYFNFRKNNSETHCRIYSKTFDRSFEFDIDDIQKGEGWENYIIGVVNELNLLGKTISGFDCIIESQLPVGSGLSSSAALECGLAGGLNELFNLGLDRVEIVKLSQRAENNFVGMNCGIMDQFASAISKKDHILKLDCRSLEYNFIPADFKNCKLLLLNTNVSHTHTDSGYNSRRKDCEDSVEIIREKYPEVQSLRDVSFEILAEMRPKLSERQYQRCEYVLEENKRVQESAEALENGKLREFGQFMYQSHEGLQHKYEVSCRELDFLVDYSRDKDFIYGSRMMGGGFGGCTINLIEADKIKSFIEEVAPAYHSQFGIELDTIIANADEGTIIKK